ncbi:anti-sigma factor domain-containing protein [Neobacillus jeddahensis]|uniref:anti-sigma factor domain-containing protein n=1 Tax=Neobacillus jeddahensis TaxID=1461580 RepID=UPI00058BFAD5|nr:anti-sigma factor domain-containing protein [Neobacillus jeddahensis]
MKKGIIMEIDEVFLTLLTPEGEFLRTRRQEQVYTIGEEIHFFPSEGTNTAKTSKVLNSIKNVFRIKTVWTVLAALLLFFGSFLPLYESNKAYAYMSIDADPSIELGVNKKMQVVELTGFNNEGKEIISKLSNWKRQDVLVLTETILTEMNKAGLNKSNNHVIISTVWTKEPKKSTEKELQKNIDKIKTTVTDQELEVTVLTATKNERKKALELGISTGKYQENKNHPSQKEQEKKTEKKKDQSTISSGDKSKVPATVQRKQQAEGIPKNNLPNWENNNGINWWDKSKFPSGQLKRSEEEALKQNLGENNKRSEQGGNSSQSKNGNQNNGNQNSWKKKDEQSNSSQPQNKWQQPVQPKNSNENRSYKQDSRQPNSYKQNSINHNSFKQNSNNHNSNKQNSNQHNDDNRHR